jgi:hypothetical protein
MVGELTPGMFIVHDNHYSMLVVSVRLNPDTDDVDICCLIGHHRLELKLTGYVHLERSYLYYYDHLFVP